MSTLTIDGLHAQLHGPENPDTIVVAAHGLCMSSTSWARVLHDVRVAHPQTATLAYDHRGHGRSPRRDQETVTIDTVARDLATVMAHARTIADRVILLGHSLGGMAILTAATAAGDSAIADGIVLVDTSSGDLCDHGLLRLVPAAVARRLPEFAQTHPAVFDRLWQIMRPALSPILGERAHCNQDIRPDATTIASILGSLRDWSVTGHLGRITAPVHALVGNLDALTPPVHARRIADGVGDGRLEVILGGHNLLLEPLGVVRIRAALSALLTPATAPVAA